MRIPFSKYHGAGNDFILIDDREGQYAPLLGQAAIAALCRRRFGIGADGLMLLGSHADFDFRMIYFNADGAPSSMCGNGARCIVAFAHRLGHVGTDCRFLAVDGPHVGRVLGGANPLEVEVDMIDVEAVRGHGDRDLVCHTGSPHLLRFVDELDGIDVVGEGRRVRNSAAFAAEGINVNFVRDRPDGGLDIVTYERGVEDETLACGTGVTAAAVAKLYRDGLAAGREFFVPVRARGGDLSVSGIRTDDGAFRQLRLRGPAEFVFDGNTLI